MMRGRFILPIIGVLLLFGILSGVSQNRSEQEAWRQGYLAGQMSVQSDGAVVVPPAAYTRYERDGFRGPGFFGIIPALLLGFIAFKIMRGGRFRQWVSEGSHHYNEWRMGPPDHSGYRGHHGRGERPVRETPVRDPDEEELI